MNKQLISTFRLPILLMAFALLLLTACTEEQSLPSTPFAMSQANVKTELTFTIIEEYTYNYELNFVRPAGVPEPLHDQLSGNRDRNGVKHKTPIDVSLQVFRVEAGKEQLQSEHQTQFTNVISSSENTINMQIYREKLVPGNYRAILVLNKVTPELADHKAYFSVAETYLGK